MRNAMICVSMMLAVFLAWPFMFGGNQASLETMSEAAAPVVAAVTKAASQSKLVPEAQAAQPVSTKPESCYKRFQRENKVCSGAQGAACRLKAADNWDLCEATGFWPD